MQLARALLFVLAGIVLAGEPAAACLPQELDVARVATVRDARTIELVDGRLVRPAGIESFGLMNDDARRADAALAARLASLLAGRQARFRFISDETDRYGRLAAFVSIDGALVQAQLAAEGSALALPQAGVSADCMGDILAAEASARDQRLAFWAKTAVLSADPGALLPHLGGYVVFEGKVVSVGTRTRRTYLDFGRRWSEDVTVIIDGRDRDVFGGAEALEALAGQRVRIRGFVEERGGPVVEARWPGQIEILGPLERGGNRS